MAEKVIVQSSREVVVVVEMAIHGGRHFLDQ